MDPKTDWNEEELSLPDPDNQLDEKPQAQSGAEQSHLAPSKETAEDGHGVAETKPSSGPVPIGAIMAGAPARQPGIAAMIPPALAPPLPSDLVDSVPQHPTRDLRAVYRRSVGAGFVGALVLLAGFAIMSWLA